MSWAKLDLARLLARHGQTEEGRALLEHRGGGRTPVHAAALFAAGTGRPAEAVALLERLPDRLRTADQSTLLRASRLAALTAVLAQGGPEEARRRLVALAARPDPGAETVSALFAPCWPAVTARARWRRPAPPPG